MTTIPDILKGYTFHSLSCGYGARPKGPRTYLSDLPRVAYKNIPEPMRNVLMFTALIDGEPSYVGKVRSTILGFKVTQWGDGELWVEEKDDE